jgi:hypothetical protein
MHVLYNVKIVIFPICTKIVGVCLSVCLGFLFCFVFVLRREECNNFDFEQLCIRQFLQICHYFIAIASSNLYYSAFSADSAEPFTLLGEGPAGPYPSLKNFVFVFLFIFQSRGWIFLAKMDSGRVKIYF